MSFEYFFLLIFGYTLSTFYGLWFVVSLVKRIVRSPFDKFWRMTPRELPPACLNDPKIGTHAYVQLKDIKLHYVEAGDHSKPLMLFLHGFPEIWYSWRHQMKEFCSEYWVVAVDLRGYGESDKPLGKNNYKLDCLVADVKNLINALGKKSCTLVAHDWGGCIAWCIILMEPQMIDSYIIMNSIHPVAFDLHIRKSFSQLRKSWYVFFFQLPWLPELWCRMDDMQKLNKVYRAGSTKSPSPVSDEDIEAFKYYFGKPGAITSALNYYRANFMLSTTNLLRGLGKDPDFPPGLLLFGEHDDFIDKEIQETTLDLVANTMLVYIEDASHFVQQDDSASVNREMRVFLEKVKTRKES